MCSWVNACKVLRTMVLKLQGTSESPTRLAKTQVAGLHPQSIWFYRSGKGPEICISNKFQRRFGRGTSGIEQCLAQSVNFLFRTISQSLSKTLDSPVLISTAFSQKQFWSLLLQWFSKNVVPRISRGTISWKLVRNAHFSDSTPVLF